MTFYSVGIRRRRGDVTLDVLYPSIQSDDQQLADCAQLLEASIGDHGVSEISIHDYFKCRDTIFPTCRRM